MATAITDDMRDANTPDEVLIAAECPPPVADPTLGIAVAHKVGATPANPLVAIGDSLTQGFKSGAIFDTDLAYPAIIAWEMGCYDRFRRPSYNGLGGLPLNLERLLHEMERRYGNEVDWWEVAPALFSLRSLMDEVQDYWERGAGSVLPSLLRPNHNLGIYGWDLRDTLSHTGKLAKQWMAEHPAKDDWLVPLVDNASEISALRVLGPDENAATVDLARQIAQEGELGPDGRPTGQGDGIDTLIVFLGANNALGCMTHLQVVWSGDDFKDPFRKSQYTVWRPSHFAAELAELVMKVSEIRARRVIWGTVPHVTIAPIARGVGGDKVRRGSRYYPYYTRPWISDSAFNPKDDENLTAAQARAVDCAIDQYNRAIVDQVKAARQQGKNWLILESCGLLDRLASRRYIDDPSARPDWWTPYELPPTLAAIEPPLTSHFFRTGPNGRELGGLFSLDGMHPTTVTYGVLAQEFINVMQSSGARFLWGDGKTPRQAPVSVDFQRLLKADTLMTSPPKSLSADLGVVGWCNEKVDLFKHVLRFGR
jgi:hypothetical protein